jgi:hypothetical protein
VIISHNGVRERQPDREAIGIEGGGQTATGASSDVVTDYGAYDVKIVGVTNTAAISTSKKPAPTPASSSSIPDGQSLKNHLDLRGADARRSIENPVKTVSVNDWPIGSNAHDCQVVGDVKIAGGSLILICPRDRQFIYAGR